MLFTERFYKITTTVLLIFIIAHIMGVVLNLIFDGSDVILENHFGKDAFLPEEETQIVREYLMNNAAEHSTKEATIKILERMKDNVPLAIADTKEQFAADYGIKSDCRTCHTTIRDGMIQDTKIKFKY